MKIASPIHTISDYKSALKRIDEIIALNPKEGTELYNELDLIGTLVFRYEEIHFPIDISKLAI
jgi:antitoxin component HigA of HigAB toxin-antitoxin module